MTTTIETPIPAKSIPSQDDVLAALNALGTTPIEVAQSLHLAGFKGNRRAAGRCPLANFLKDAFTPQGASVFSHATLYFGPWGILSEEVVAVVTPPAAREFIALFDNGKFPSLDVEITAGEIA
jgi:hypothetical protein